MEISKRTKTSAVLITVRRKKVYKEFMLYAIGRNLLKYHGSCIMKSRKYEGKKEQKAA